jgi:malonyl-CoA/methylmalonyl-CoA synthetase
MPSTVDPCDWIDAAGDRGQRVFLRTPRGPLLRYADLAAQSARVVSALATLGVQAGDRVLVQADKSVDVVLLYVACLRMGAIFVPVNTANTLHELEHFLNDATPRVAVVRPSDLAVIEPFAAAAGVRHLETMGSNGEGTLVERVRQSAPASPGRFAPDQPAAIVYTSGTTGRSKGAVLTRANLGSNAAVLADAWRFTESDLLLHTLPLNHVHGLFVAINTVLASGSALLLMPKFDAATVVEQLPHVTVYMGVPTHYVRLLQEPSLDRRLAASMRLFVSGSAPLLADTHGQFLARTGHTILERYGMTETLMITSNPYEGARVAGAVGPPLAGVSVRITHSGGDVGQSVGGIEVRGPNVFAGYWRDAEKTREEFTADGWFKTGDLGRIDADGYLHIVGRAKDLVISGGYNVYPKEVEAELDAIGGVRESAVFGVPHPDFGEGVTAAVVTDAGATLSEADILGAVKRRLAAYKVPKRVVFMDELPRNAMGKVQKNVLRAGHAALYGARPPP